MVLAPGSRLGAYEILSLIGEGGMGKVYKARDTRLDRAVAVKVMAPDLAADPQFRARFDREARAISQLSHPHICTLYDVADADGAAFLVMQLLEGQTLADRLKRGALPLDEALNIAIDVADALSAAHKQGIVHRDLKPANIMLIKTGAKLLDFGLAKPSKSVPSLTASSSQETGSTHLTVAGTILGTLHYMAPEQVEGRDADVRADIWALGAVLYEMVTGTRPFDGESGASIIGAILKDTPPAVSSRRPPSPPALDSIVDQCLRKDPDDRWQSAADVKRTLQWVRSGTAPGSVVSRMSVRSRAPWFVAAAALVTALGAVVWTLATQKVSARPDRRVFSIAVPAQIQIAGASAISPDGSRFAFVGLGTDDPPGLYVMSLRSGSVQRLADTQYASLPFWSLASDRLGFFANGKLMVISVGGGPPKVLAPAPNGRGGAWAADGTILFVPTPNSPVLRISDGGGTAVPVTSLDTVHGVIGHRWPTFVDDRHFVLTMQAAKPDVTGLYLGSLDSSALVRIATPYSNSVFANGRLLFVVNGMIVAQQLDVARARLVGNAAEIAGPAAFSGGVGFEAFSAAADGSMLAYAPGSGSGATSEIQWLDRTAPATAPSRLTTGTDLGRYDAYYEQLSPDGGAMVVAQFRASTPDLWLLDFRRDVLERFTFDDGTELNPVWSPDGSELMFSSNRAGFYNIHRRSRGGLNEEQLFTKAPASHQYVTDWSRDGRTIVYTNVDAMTASDIWSANADGREEPRVVLRTQFNEYAGRLSPDGQWLAFSSDESGQPEIYVQRFPSGADRKPVTSQGGSEPQWRADGRELFYVGANHILMAVPISFSPLNIGRPIKVHDTAIDLSIGSMHALHYTAAADGQRFLANISRAGPPTTIVLNWESGVRQ